MNVKILFKYSCTLILFKYSHLLQKNVQLSATIRQQNSVRSKSILYTLCWKYCILIVALGKLNLFSVKIVKLQTIKINF